MFDETEATQPYPVHRPSPVDAHSLTAVGGAVHPLRRRRIGCRLASPAELRALQGWAAQHLAHADVVPLELAEARACAGHFQAPDLMLVERPSAEDEARLCEPWAVAGAMELIVIDAPFHMTSRLRERGVHIALELRGPCSSAQLGHALRRVLDLHGPLRSLCSKALGQMHLPDALNLVRRYMLTEALRATTSKRAAAKMLGVTRSAVQQMAQRLGV